VDASATCPSKNRATISWNRMKCVSIECSQRTPNTGGSNFNPIKLHLTNAGKQVKTTYEVLLGRRPCVRIANTVSALTKNRKISLPSSSIDLASDDIRRTSAATPKRTRSVHWSLVLSEPDSGFAKPATRLKPRAVATLCALGANSNAVLLYDVLRSLPLPSTDASTENQTEQNHY
jgi:hypothetical protein